MAQKKTVTGIVTDVSGEYVIGASVMEVGTTNGTITDVEGRFSLTVNPTGKIQITYIGYEPQVIEIKNQIHLKIKLKEDSQILDEVVVTGYGGTPTSL